MKSAVLPEAKKKYFLKVHIFSFFGGHIVPQTLSLSLSHTHTLTLSHTLTKTHINTFVVYFDQGLGAVLLQTQVEMGFSTFFEQKC